MSARPVPPQENHGQQEAGCATEDSRFVDDSGYECDGHDGGREDRDHLTDPLPRDATGPSPDDLDEIAVQTQDRSAAPALDELVAAGRVVHGTADWT